MVNWEASQCCPDIIMVPPQYDDYLKYSKLTRTIYERHTDQVEGYGMDEGWCDVSGRSPEKQYSSLRQTTAGQEKSMP
jgi:DNA polymerase-4